MDIDELLRRAQEISASDVHLRVGSSPVLRIDGILIGQEDIQPLTIEDMDLILERITTVEKRNSFARELAVDFAYSLAGTFRFRVGVIRQKGTVSIVFHRVPLYIPSIDEMELPQLYKELALKPRGLILVTGPTGNGKSTTLATMINHVNENLPKSVISIEDPIEFVHHNKKSIVAQQELGEDTTSFDKSLIHAVRHNPDVIVVGEMRDLKTISAVITAAETGHLVLGTLHTTDAVQTIDRVVDLFPPIQQQQIKLQLSQVLEAVLSQTLVPRIGGGRIAAVEILVVTNAIRNLIREGKTYQIRSTMELGSKHGMQTLNQALAELVMRGLVTREDAMMKSSNPLQLKELLGFSGVIDAKPWPPFIDQIT
ncbi:type IV pilus twitching motility protein PilT [Chloroflexota bacterium]